MENINDLYNSTIQLLKEADKKRDQILVFYTTLIALFLEFILPLVDDKPLLFFIINFIVILFSWFIGLTLISLRRWHNIYVSTGFVFRTLMINHLHPTNALVREYWDTHNKRNEEIKKGKDSWFRRTENLIISAFITISVIPICTLVYGIAKKITNLFTINFLMYRWYHTPPNMFIHIQGLLTFLLVLIFVIGTSFLILYLCKMVRLTKEADNLSFTEIQNRGWLLQDF